MNSFGQNFCSKKSKIKKLRKISDALACEIRKSSKSGTRRHFFEGKFPNFLSEKSGVGWIYGGRVQYTPCIGSIKKIPYEILTQNNAKL